MTLYLATIIAVCYGITIGDIGSLLWHYDWWHWQSAMALRLVTLAVCYGITIGDIDSLLWYCDWWHWQYAMALQLVHWQSAMALWLVTLPVCYGITIGDIGSLLWHCIWRQLWQSAMTFRLATLQSAMALRWWDWQSAMAFRIGDIDSLLWHYIWWHWQSAMALRLVTLAVCYGIVIIDIGSLLWHCDWWHWHVALHMIGGFGSERVDKTRMAAFQRHAGWSDPFTGDTKKEFGKVWRIISPCLQCNKQLTRWYIFHAFSRRGLKYPLVQFKNFHCPVQKTPHISLLPQLVWIRVQTIRVANTSGQTCRARGTTRVQILAKVLTVFTCNNKGYHLNKKPHKKLKRPNIA